MALMGSLNKSIFQFKITIIGSNPPIWRRIQVPSNFSFYRFHRAIQDSVGWEGKIHCWDFKVKGQGVYIGVTDSDSSASIIDAKQLKICSNQGFSAVGDKAIYEYDFGDSWEHEVLLEAILPLQSQIMIYPKCIDGNGSCPPEGCGGVNGYKALLESLADPDHPEHQEKKALMKRFHRNQRNFNPEAFNCLDVEFRDFVTL